MILVEKTPKNKMIKTLNQGGRQMMFFRYLKT
jgi:hypothetical protein